MPTINDHLKISVIIPIFQAEKYLAQTLKSISKQTMLPDELVISDDESTDKSLNIIEDFRQQVSFDIKLIHHKRNGPTKNYLNAIKHTSGDIIIVSDQDDAWLSEKIELVTSAFKGSNSIMLVSHDSLIADHNLNSTKQTIRGGIKKSRSLSARINTSNDIKNFKYFIKGGLPFLAHTLSFRKELIPYLINKPKNIDNWWLEEWLTCIAACIGRIALIPNHLVIYRQHNSQTSGGFQNSKTKQDILQNKNKNIGHTNKIDKMNYCEKIMSGTQASDKNKIALINSYINFLVKRENLLLKSTSRIAALIDIVKIAVKGKYHQFAQHIFSICLDIIKVLKHDFK